MGLNIRISKEGNVPLHEQLAAQIVLLIGSGKLKPGDALPSSRELESWLDIHRNTVVQAYQDAILNLLVEKTQGRRLVVRRHRAQPGESIDALVDSFLVEARQRGYTLEQLSRKIQQRMLAPPPERVLVVSDDAGMRVLLPVELNQRFGCPVEAWGRRADVGP